jgi:hypothetical protein
VVADAGEEGAADAFELLVVLELPGAADNDRAAQAEMTSQSTVLVIGE